MTNVSGYKEATKIVASKLEKDPELDLSYLLTEVGRDYMLTPTQEEALRSASIRLRNKLRNKN